MAVASPQAPADDPRLAKRIEIHAGVEPASNVCRLLADATGVSVTVEPALKEDLLALSVRDRPAAEIMDRIASHFSWTWRRVGEGYELARTAAFLNQEGLGRTGYWSRAAKPAVAAARKFLARWGSIDTIEQARLAIDLSSKYDALLVAGEAETKRGDELRARASTASFTSDPLTKLACELLSSLTPQDLASIGEGRLVFSTKPTPWQRAMPTPCLSRIAKALGDLARLKEMLGSLPTERSTDDGVSYLGSDLDRLDEVAKVRACVSSFEWIDVQLIGGDGELLLERTVPLPPGSVPKGEPQRFDGAESDLPQELKRSFASEGSLRKSYESLLSAAGGGFPVGRTGEAEPLSPLGRFFGDLAGSAGYAFIGDVFDDHSVWFFGEELHESVASTLNRICDLIGAQWRADGGWISVRTQDWGYARSHQAPRANVWKARDLRDRQGGLSFDQIAGIWDGISADQIESPVLRSAIRGPFEGGDKWMGRMWGAMSPALRSRLAAGESVSLVALPPRSRAAAERFLYLLGKEISDSAIGRREDMSVFSEPETYPWFSERLSVAPDGVDREITELLPRGLAEVQLQLRQADIPMLMFFDESSSGSEARLFPPQATAWFFSSATQAPKVPLGGNPYLAVADAHVFRFSVNANRTAIHPVSGLRGGRRLEPAFSTWPEDLRNRVAAWWRASQGGNDRPAPPP